MNKHNFKFLQSATETDREVAAICTILEHIQMEFFLSLNIEQQLPVQKTLSEKSKIKYNNAFSHEEDQNKAFKKSSKYLALQTRIF